MSLSVGVSHQSRSRRRREKESVCSRLFVRGADSLLERVERSNPRRRPEVRLGGLLCPNSRASTQGTECINALGRDESCITSGGLGLDRHARLDQGLDVVDTPRGKPLARLLSGAARVGGQGGRRPGEAWSRRGLYGAAALDVHLTSDGADVRGLGHRQHRRGTRIGAGEDLRPLGHRPRRDPLGDECPQLAVPLDVRLPGHVGRQPPSSPTSWAKNCGSSAPTERCRPSAVS